MIYYLIMAKRSRESDIIETTAPYMVKRGKFDPSRLIIYAVKLLLSKRTQQYAD